MPPCLLEHALDQGPVGLGLERVAQRQQAGLGVEHAIDPPQRPCRVEVASGGGVEGELGVGAEVQRRRVASRGVADGLEVAAHAGRGEP